MPAARCAPPGSPRRDALRPRRAARGIVLARSILVTTLALLLVAAPAGLGATSAGGAAEKAEPPADAARALGAGCSLGDGTHPLVDGVTTEASLEDLGGASCAFSFEPVAGMPATRIVLPPMAPADFDLYVKRGSPPTTSSWECRPFAGGSATETCTVDNDGQAVHILVLRYSGSGAFSILGEGTVPPPACSLGSGTTDLASGVPVTASLADAPKASCRFSFNATSGGDLAKLDLTDLSGDFDLYVKLGSPPTTLVYDCRSIGGGPSPETCGIGPQGQTVYALVIRHAGSGSFTITANEIVVPQLRNGVPVVGSSTQGSQHVFKLVVPEDSTFVSFVLAGDMTARSCGIVTCSPDADLYVRKGLPPTLSSRDCRPWADGTTESCTFTHAYGLAGDPVDLGVRSPSSVRPFLGQGVYYVMVHGHIGATDWVLHGART